MALDPALLSTVRVGELPPEVFSLTDNIAHEVGTDLKRGTVQQLVDIIVPLVSALQFQVIELDVDASYLAANFDSTGLGTNLCLGYAICNGANGTRDRNGLVSIAYGAGYTSIGGLGGNKDAVLVAHSHRLLSAVWSGNNTEGLSTSNTIAGRSIASTNYFSTAVSGATFVETSGVPATDKNMQPYIITLKIQKL